MKTNPQEMLASEGGSKAVNKLGPFPSKLGQEELWELIDLREFSPDNRQRIKGILEHEFLGSHPPVVWGMDLAALAGSPSSPDIFMEET